MNQNKFSVSDLFEGLDDEQADELTRRIVQSAYEARRAIADAQKDARIRELESEAETRQQAPAREAEEKRLADLERAEAEEIAKWRGNAGKVTRIRQKYRDLRNARPESPAESAEPIDTATLEQTYREALSKIPKGNVRAITELKRRYRAQGLDVW